MDADHLPKALDDIRAGGRADGLDIRTQVLDPAELRWYVEEALHARAVHDEEGPADAASAMFDEEEGPPYPVLALLVRARLAALPQAPRPAGRRGHADVSAHAATVLEAFASIIGGAGGGPRSGFGDLRSGRPAPAKLPAKRKKTAGPAPIYQVKVGLRGAKPPIWRRLLVPADVSLARMHDVIQAAFGWEDSHMHVFETPYGEFGRADRQLGHGAAAPVTLEQVAAQARDKIRYTYDFGDDWCMRSWWRRSSTGTLRWTTRAVPAGGAAERLRRHLGVREARGGARRSGSPRAPGAIGVAETGRPRSLWSA